MIAGCIATGLMVFAVTVFIGVIIHNDVVDNKIDKLRATRKELDMWRTRCYHMNKQIRETAGMLVDGPPAPRFETKWDEYFKEGE